MAKPTHGTQARPGLHRVEPIAGDARRPALVSVPEQWSAGHPAALAVLLHGAMGSAEQGLSLLEPFAAQAGIIVLAPASRGYTWDAVIGKPGPDLQVVSDALRWVFDRYAVDENHLAVGGFSDGASYALSLGMGGALFTHVLALSPGFAPHAAPKGNARFFISHGRQDRVLPIGACSRSIVASLQEAGREVDYLEFDGGHEIPPDIARAAVDWLLPGQRQ